MAKLKFLNKLTFGQPSNLQVEGSNQNRIETARTLMLDNLNTLSHICYLNKEGSSFLDVNNTVRGIFIKINSKTKQHFGTNSVSSYIFL